MDFSAFSLLLTENCNLACKYCYETTGTGHKNKNMSVETALKAVRFMFDQKNEEVVVSFFGGEPTLMPEIIDLICKEGKRLSKIYNKPFYAGMITNATNMSEKLYNILRDHLDVWQSTQLSIDGPKEIQDMYRVTKSGKGSFARIEKNVPYWKALYDQNKLNIHGVLNKYSIPKLYDSFKFFREEWNVEKLWFLPAKGLDYTSEDVSLYERELKKIYEYVMEHARRTHTVDEIAFYAPLDRALRDGKMGKPCGAGDNYCTITSDGDVWPCHHFYFIDPDKNLYLGNIFEGIDKGKKLIWEQYDADDMIGCEDCPHGTCYRCIAENYEEYGTPFTQIKGYHCEFMLIDFKYQQMIKKELIEMGLLNQENNGKSDCNGLVRDCVGKQGDCPNVVSVNECKFDRGNEHSSGTPSFNELQKTNPMDIQECNGDGTCCGCGSCCNNEEFGNVEEIDVEGKSDNEILKNILDDVIKVLVKYHNEL